MISILGIVAWFIAGIMSAKIVIGTIMKADNKDFTLDLLLLTIILIPSGFVGLFMTAILCGEKIVIFRRKTNGTQSISR